MFNTLVTFTLFCNTYNLHNDNVVCAYFGGDDSLLVLKEGTFVKPIDEVASKVMNLTTKILDTS